VEYEVESKETSRGYIVRFDHQTCTCREWQLKGYPCGHGLAVIITMNEDLQTFAKPFFHLDAYRKTYANHIYAPNSHDEVGPLTYRSHRTIEELSDSDNSDDVLLPPSTCRSAGAPKKQRIRTQEEIDQDGKLIATRIFRCGRCGGVGHSKRTCSEAIH